ncbi:MAG: acyl-CoA thioesterase [Fusobacteriaceae bacterium]
MFVTEYKVTVRDINYGGHMGNEVPLLLFQQVRIDFLKSYSLSEVDIGDGIGTIQRESHVKYNREVFLGDKLKISIDKIEIEKLSLKFYYTVYNELEVNVVEGATLMLAYNYKLKKVSKVPESFRKIIEKISEKN